MCRLKKIKLVVLTFYPNENLDPRYNLTASGLRDHRLIVFIGPVGFSGFWSATLAVLLVVSNWYCIYCHTVRRFLTNSPLSFLRMLVCQFLARCIGLFTCVLCLK